MSKRIVPPRPSPARADSNDTPDHPGIQWWNALSPDQRREWLERANSARPADAYAAFRAWARGDTDPNP